MKAQVFVSYASRDRERIVPIVDRLEAAGASVWIDQRGIDPASLWFQEIVEAIDACILVLLVASPSSFASENVVKELALAAARKKPILPLYLEPVKIPSTMEYQLTGIQHLELSAGREEETFSRLLGALAQRGVALAVAGGGEAARPRPAGSAKALARLGGIAGSFARSPLERELATRLREGPLRTIVVHGLPGVGKTILVCRTLAELAGELPEVVALRLEGPAAVEPGFALAELDSVLRSRGGGLDPRRFSSESADRILDDLVAALAALPPSPPLVVLDGGEFARGSWPATLLAALSRAPGLRVVATSRERTLSGAQAHALAVPPLGADEAREFIAHWAGILGLELDAGELWRRLPRQLRSHPQALATLLAQLVDVPLDLLLAVGLPEEVATPARLVGRIVDGLAPEVRESLALAALLSTVDLQAALAELALDPPRELPSHLQALLARSLVRRVGGVYEVPEIVAQALAETDPQLLGRTAERLESAWLAATAAGRTAKRTDRFATLAPPIAHRFRALGLSASLRRMLDEELLETLNQRGFWKEYSVLVEIALDAAREASDRAPRFRLACRLVRKRIQLGDGAGARTALAEVESLVEPAGETRERAELHSHRALLHQLERDEVAVERELAASRSLRDEIGDAAGVAMIDKQIGHLHLRRREDEEAAARLAAASAGFTACGDTKNRLDAETSLALCELRRGDLEPAERRLRAVVDECHESSLESMLPRAHFHLSLLEDRRGRADAALAHAREAVRLADASGNTLIRGLARAAASRLVEAGERAERDVKSEDAG